jgi:hypothetical protein
MSSLEELMEASRIKDDISIADKKEQERKQKIAKEKDTVKRREKLYENIDKCIAEAAKEGKTHCEIKLHKPQICCVCEYVCYCETEHIRQLTGRIKENVSKKHKIVCRGFREKNYLERNEYWHFAFECIWSTSAKRLYNIYYSYYNSPDIAHGNPDSTEILQKILQKFKPDSRNVVIKIDNFYDEKPEYNIKSYERQLGVKVTHKYLSNERWNNSQYTITW